MFFCNYLEVDYEHASFNTFFYIHNNKLLLENTYDLINDMLFLRLSFCFNKVIDADSTRIYNYIFFLWLITGKLAIISKFTSELVLGVKYYNIFLNVYVDDFRFLDFLINGWLPLLHSNFYKVTSGNNIVYLYIFDFDLFNNIRLSYNTYMYTINEPLVVSFFGVNNFFKLNLFKLI